MTTVDGPAYSIALFLLHGAQFGTAVERIRTAYATMLNNKPDEVAELLGIPPGVTLVCFPVATPWATNSRLRRGDPLQYHLLRSVIYSLCPALMARLEFRWAGCSGRD